MTTIALAGNPNAGKTTLFNSLTGSHQYVGNWPGVTVEKKTGEYLKDKKIHITDLPGTYSLSPYTLEEVIARNYLLEGEADVIIDVVDGTNIERNLYLTTQLAELGIPIVIALNMMDLVKKSGDEIHIGKLEKEMGCRIIPISAATNEGIDELVTVALEEASKSYQPLSFYSKDVNKAIEEIEAIEALKNHPAKRFLAVKLFEMDEKVEEDFELSSSERENLDLLIERVEDQFDDDTESIITNERYDFVTKASQRAIKKSHQDLSASDKIDRVVTNRFLAIPIFILAMVLVYKIALDFVGGPITDFTNDVVVDTWIKGSVATLLTSIGVADWILSLIVDGIISGVGAVLGFLPIIAALFFFIAILEDCGYMSRVAFILDRVLRRFGLSGKSFIPILMGTGCSVPAIMGTRTIENRNDRRMTIMVSSFMPCGAKADIIAAFGALFAGVWWYAPLWYFGGILAIIISGVILKKTSAFHGEPAPFVMEMPDYHLPRPRNVLRTTYERCKSFVVKAGTIITVAMVGVWFLQNISVNFEFVEFSSETNTILEWVGTKLAFIFKPLGFGNWMATVATFLGLVAKEVVVGTLGVIAGLGEVSVEDPSLATLISQTFTPLAMISFVFFNQLTVPCFAAVGAIKSEMNSNKWTLFAVLYQLVFSWTISLMIYQFGSFALGGPFTPWTGLALAILALYLYLLLRPNPYKDMERVTVKDLATSQR